MSRSYFGLSFIKRGKRVLFAKIYNYIIFWQDDINNTKTWSVTNHKYFVFRNSVQHCFHRLLLCPCPGKQCRSRSDTWRISCLIRIYAVCHSFGNGIKYNLMGWKVYVGTANDITKQRCRLRWPELNSVDPDQTAQISLKF